MPLLMETELADRLRPLYARMWADIPTDLRERKLSMSLPEWGDLYPHSRNQGLLVVDQADYGHALPPHVVLDADEAVPPAGPRSTEWAENSPKNRATQFMRLVRDLSVGLYGEKQGWARHIAWTSLFKVFASQGPEAYLPSLRLRKAQLRAATAALFAEIEVLSPHVVLFLASSDETDVAVRTLIGARRFDEGATVNWGRKPIYVIPGSDTHYILSPHPRDLPNSRLSDTLLSLLLDKLP